jgi:hypothetical protein
MKHKAGGDRRGKGARKLERRGEKKIKKVM